MTHQLNPDSLAATAELTPRCSVRPSYRLLRPRSRENLYPAGTSHFPRPWAGHVRRDCLTVDVKRVLQATGASQTFLPPSPFTLLFTGANHGFLPPSLNSRVQNQPFCPRHPIIDVVPHLLLSRSCAIWEYQCSKSGIVEVTLIVSGEKIIILHPGIVRIPCGERR